MQPCYAMAKQLHFNKDGSALKKMQAGVDKLASVVGITLGPKVAYVVQYCQHGHLSCPNLQHLLSTMAAHCWSMHGIVVVPARSCCGLLVACADEDMNVDGAGAQRCSGEQVWQPTHCE